MASSSKVAGSSGSTANLAKGQDSRSISHAWTSRLHWRGLGIMGVRTWLEAKRSSLRKIQQIFGDWWEGFWRRIATQRMYWGIASGDLKAVNRTLGRLNS